MSISPLLGNNVEKSSDWVLNCGGYSSALVNCDKRKVQMPIQGFRGPANSLRSLRITICWALLACWYGQTLLAQQHSDRLSGKWQNKWRQSLQLFHFDNKGTFDEIIGGFSSRGDPVMVCSGTYTSEGSHLSLAVKRVRPFQGPLAAQTCPEVESFAYHFDGPDRLVLESPAGTAVLTRCSPSTGLAGSAGDGSRRPSSDSVDVTDVSDKAFWGACGDVLGAPSVTDDDLQRRVRAIIRGELEDKKVVEVEVTEAVLDRINGWAKTLAFFAGIPMALLLGVLGVLGFRKYSDLWQLVSAAEDKIKPTIDHAEKTANEVEQKTNGLQTRAKEMDSRMERAEKTAADLEGATSELKKRNEEVRKLFDALEPQLRESERQARAYEDRLVELRNSVDSRVTGLERDVSDIKHRLRPGKERWPVKTGSDNDASRVSATPVDAEIEELAKLKPPKNLRDPKLQNSRYPPAELTIYTVEATIIAIKLQMSGNYTLVLQNEKGATMRAQSPNPDPFFVPASSRWAKEIETVRKVIDAKLVAERFITTTRAKARITGVGFFTHLRGQTGVAPNGFELHPVIKIEFFD
jgi:hypothetical protein